MSNAALQRYFHDLETHFKSGRATEHSYRPALKTFLENLVTDIHAINEPKRERCGAPDYVIERDGLTIGHVEA